MWSVQQQQAHNIAASQPTSHPVEHIAASQLASQAYRQPTSQKAHLGGGEALGQAAQAVTGGGKHAHDGLEGERLGEQVGRAADTASSAQ